MRLVLGKLTALRALLVVCFFVCPLLFFTNLTRNPYITQIVLLNLGLLLSGALLLVEISRQGARPRTALDLPWLAWAGVCLLSWALSYLLHAPFFRPSMSAEGLKALLFLVANCAVPFYLAASYCGDPAEGEADPGPWAVFCVVWGGLWLMFPSLRGPGGGPLDLTRLIWDGYGAALWGGGLAAALWLCRRGRWGDFLHLSLSVGFLASAYGVLQYFNHEIVWNAALNPYGGRSVSTFGNPNFLSSYNVVLFPVAAALFSRADGGRRALYAVLALTLEAALLCCLTRSSWIGAAVGVAVLLLSSEIRARAAAAPRPHGLLFCAAVAMALLWPASRIAAGYAPSVIGRVSEVVEAAKAGAAYGSFYQRVLIWSSGWLMGSENPLTGKGYGLFELFYPFYQGHIVSIHDVYRGMRTHANNGHNELVEVFSQTGLLGLGVFAWMWTAFFADARRWASSKSGSLHWAMAAGVAGMLADNMLNVSLHFAVPAFMFWWAAGAVAARRDPVTAASPGWRWGARAAAAALVLFCWVWVCLWFREVHYFAGFKLIRNRAQPAAIKELEASRRWGPREVNSIYELGNAYAQTEQHPKAVEAYRGALKANAGYDEIYYNIGAIMATRLGDQKGAVDYFLMAHWINPLSAEAYNSLSNLYFNDLPRYSADALAMLRLAVRLFPDNASHWSNLGYLMGMDKRWEDAEAAYARAVMADPGLAQAEQGLFWVAQQSGRPKAKALVTLSQLRELDALLARRDYSERTLALSRKLEGELPGNPKLRFYTGSLLLARGRPAEAGPILEEVVARQPNHAAARVNLGEVYLAAGRLSDAAAQYRAVLSIDPANEAAKRRLEQLSAQPR